MRSPMRNDSRSHCRFWDSVPTKLNGEPNIRSVFRFNVEDLSGRYYAPLKPILNLTSRRTEQVLSCVMYRANISQPKCLGRAGGFGYEKCGEVPDKPLRKDYFPKEARSSLLSEVLASVISVGYLDGVDRDSNARYGKKIRRR
ncbi:hypothetical protein N7537_003820 [Penicillium hordei]|uniref:Uncharacterized protein n=1 Tax=Penicillium hordei TaxID=40994 RepID=A0AAD6EA47_9EURO|nr:uncharacterized protein N7537_003820 [Penicillium hordei]KAJ5607201.1 hypothetical protein N7537_003820 [Penicillium hordei]